MSEGAFYGNVMRVFYLETPSPNGTKTFEISERQAAEFPTNPAKVAAEVWGAISTTEYENWRASRYDVQCTAIQKNGKQCKNSVAGCNQVKIDKWRYFQGDYCAKHGGESADENNKNFKEKHPSSE